MKGKQTLLVLETLKQKPISSYELLKKMFEADYGEAYRAMAKKSDRARAAKAMQLRYHNFLYKLKQDGLIREERDGQREGGTVQFRILEKGMAKLAVLRQREPFPSPAGYKREEGAGITIVAFDIPESSRKKRDWLRSVLRTMGFTMIQRSVWAGKVRIPVTLLRDFQELKIVKYVEIFQTTKTGILQQLDL
jgi:DNA-binding transcriptional regulator PaaX